MVRVQFTKRGTSDGIRVFCNEMEETVANTALETKLIQLQLTTKRTDRILAKTHEESTSQHQTNLRMVIGQVDKLRLTVEAEKIAAKEDTTEWNVQIDAKISEADAMYERLKNGWQRIRVSWWKSRTKKRCNSR